LMRFSYFGRNDRLPSRCDSCFHWIYLQRPVTRFCSIIQNLFASQIHIWRVRDVSWYFSL